MTKGRRHDLVSWVTVADTWGCLYGFRQAAEAAGVRRRCRLWLAPTTDIVLLVQGVDDLAGKAFTHPGSELCQPVPDPAPAGMARASGSARSAANPTRPGCSSAIWMDRSVCGMVREIVAGRKA